MYRPPLEASANELEALFLLSRKKQVLLLEGITARFLPPIHRLSEVVEEGAIGEVLSLQADASYLIPFDPQHSFFEKRWRYLTRTRPLSTLLWLAVYLGAARTNDRLSTSRSYRNRRTVRTHSTIQHRYLRST